MVAKIDSGSTGLSFAEETSLKILPAVPVWYALEPDGYSDFGEDLKMISRDPLGPSRQDKKGTVVDSDAKAGFTMDYTQNSMTRLLQGFFFADARELPSTKPLNGTQVVVTGAAADSSYSAASGLNVFTAGTLVLVSGFENAANNGLKLVSASTATKLTTDGAFVVETGSPAVVIQQVGTEFSAGDAGLVKTGNVIALTLTAGTFTGMPGIIPGSWIFIGGDSAGNAFSSTGFARISTISAKSITFDDITWGAGASESGAGKTVRIFTGIIIKNEKNPALIKRRSYTFERSVGYNGTDDQFERSIGAMANNVKISMPLASKVTAELNYVSCASEYSTGAPATGVRVPIVSEEAINTTSNLYRMKMSVRDPSSSNPTPLFGYVTELNFDIMNNVSPLKALGVFGAFEATAGNFQVKGSTTTFFTNVAAIQAVKNNADVGLSVIACAKNAGFLFDLPLVGLSGGKLKIEKNQAIQISLEASGAENKYGYTLQHQSFAYLPNVAMP